VPTDHTTRVLVIDDDTTAATQLVGFLVSRKYEVATCGGLDATLVHSAPWRPHVLLLALSDETPRGAGLSELRHRYPRQPIVLLTADEGLELLLDLEAYAPTLPVRPARGLKHIESVVAAASGIE
jgi:DNA-binding response OmpR family regulator